MALINCPECNASVSDAAASCPKCGHRMRAIAAGDLPGHKANKSGMSTVAWMGIAVVIIIFALFALIGTCNWAPV